jgi:hypothetical protein
MDQNFIEPEENIQPEVQIEVAAVNTSLSSLDSSVDSAEADDIERMQQMLNGRRPRAPFLLV